MTIRAYIEKQKDGEDKMKNHTMPFVKIFDSAKIIGIEHIEFGKYVIIDDFVFISAKQQMKIGDHVHIASHSSITGIDRFTMDSFSGLSQGCRIFTGSEDFIDWGFGNPTVSPRFRNVKTGPIRIDRFACIGANSVILPGVHIGEGATVGANSVVSKNLEPWGVYVGNHKIRKRNKENVLRTYEDFMQTPIEKRVGNLFES